MPNFNYFLKYVFIISLLFISFKPSFALTEKQAIGFFHLNHKHSVKFLDIKAYQQTQEYTCGPAIVMSLLKYYGKLSDKQMNKLTEMRIAKEMGTTESEGTSAIQIVQWLNAHGFDAKTQSDGSVEMLRNNLAKGIPVLVDWIDWGGHWVAVAGYDFGGTAHNMNNDIIFFADPAANCNRAKTLDGITLINPERFSSMWFSSKLERNIYIIATPKS